MKKRVKFVLLILLLLVITTAPNFCVQKTGMEAIASDKIEFSNVQDLISINPSGILNAVIEHNCTPFDSETNSIMPGSVITPNHDDYGQVAGITFSVPTFSPTKAESAYVWLYLTQHISFELYIEFNDGFQDKCYWQFDDDELYALGSGWKLFELNFGDASYEGTDIFDASFNNFRVRYKSGVDEYETKTTEFFSLYHLFLADKNMSETGVVDSIARVNFKLKDNNYLTNGNVFVGDKIVFDTPETIFEYIYVGKYDLAHYNVPGRFIWEIEIYDTNGAKEYIDFGDSYTFTSDGGYGIAIRLYEDSDFSTDVILNYVKSIYATALSLGRFTMGSTYKINDDDVLVLTFQLSDLLVLTSNLEFSLSNNNAEIDTYYEENGIYYIKVKALKSGSTTLSVSAKARSGNSTKNKDFSVSAKIDIKSTETEFDISMLILWITFGAFCVFMLIYFIKILVQSRKNDVK